MNFDLDILERIYALLPSVYRIHDVEHGESLKQLLSVIAEQVAVLEEDIAQLYDDQFIETCAQWAVPYIGDLIGARGLHALTTTAFTRRAQVANTLAYRRRKGTAAVLEQLARDTTDWDARAVEFFQLLATTQYMNHLRPTNLYAPNLRQWEPLERLNTPFENLAHTADIRRIASGRGKYNIHNVGIFLWRLHSYSLTESPAYSIDARRYTFSPLGNNTPLYSFPETEDKITHIAEPINVPMPISRRVLHEYFDTYYGKGKSLSLTVNGGDIAKDKIVICDLSDINGGVWAHMPKKKYAIDPVLGRIVLPENLSPNPSVTVSFRYGFSAEMGGGEYGRAGSFAIDSESSENVPSDHTKIQDALDQVKNGGTVEITDNGRYEEALTVQIDAGKHIELRAAEKQRPNLVLKNELIINGEDNARMTLNGLLISGSNLRVSGKLEELHLRHCTLVPGLTLSIDGTPEQPDAPALIVDSEKTTVVIEHSIVGGLRVGDGAEVRITGSIVDAVTETSVAYASTDDKSAGGKLYVENSTFIGKVHTVLMELASNTIFLSNLEQSDVWKAPVLAKRLQAGCVRFSYLPWNSQVPRRYRCQPADEHQGIRVRPQFTSLRYGDAGYCQLSQRCALEIRQGADDEAEMGAFHDLYQPQRETNLRVCLDEYLRFGLETGIFYSS
jgi:hypothetical protein